MTVASVNNVAVSQPRWAALIAAYGAFVLACITLLQSTVAEMVTLWATSSSWRHGFFVAPMALWMIYAHRHEAPLPKANFIACGLVLAAALLWLAGQVAGIALIEHFAFVSLLIAGVAVIFGLAVTRQYAFPLAFLYFMVPFGEVLVPGLQTITTISVSALLKLGGVGLINNGTVIITQAGGFNIAAACAGLNFLLVALMASAYFAHAWFSRWEKALMFAAIAVAAAIATNILRISAIIFLAGVTPPEWRIAADHYLIGLALYAVMIVILLAIGRRLADRREREAI